MRRCLDVGNDGDLGDLVDAAASLGSCPRENHPPDKVGCLQGDHLGDAAASENPNRSTCFSPSARMKATASLPISSIVCGTDDPVAPMPRLSNAITRWWAAMPSMILGSQSSSTAVKWCRKTTGTPESVPNSR